MFAKLKPCVLGRGQPRSPVCRHDLCVLQCAAVCKCTEQYDDLPGKETVL